MKKLLVLIGIALCTVILTVAALLFFVDPNQFKPLIVEQTKKQTGMELVIDGDIEWQIFPSIGLSLGKTELRNVDGFKHDNLLKIDAIEIEVSVLPLLNHQLAIGNVSLDGASIYLETRKDGISNLDHLAKADSAAAANNDASTASDSGKSPSQDASKGTIDESSVWDINLAGISISQALLEIQNDQTGSYTKLYDVGLQVSEFSFGQWTAVSFSAKGKNNQQLFTTAGEAEINLSADMADYQLRNIVLDSSFSDPSTDISSAKIELSSFEFNKENPLKVTVQGRAAELAIELALDAKLGIDQSMSQLSLTDMALKSSFSGEGLPQSPLNISGQSSLKFDLDKRLLSLVLQQLSLNDIQLDGKADVTLAQIPKIRFALHSPAIDLDKFLGLKQTSSNKSREEAGKPSEPAPSTTASEAEPDLSALHALDMKGSISFDRFKANNVSLQDVKSSFRVNRGVADLDSFTANLYQGSIRASAQLDGRKVPASYWVKKDIDAVQIQPLLKDVADNDVLEGTGHINVDLSGKGLTPSGIKKNIAGTVKINFADGAVNGVNIAQLIRTNYAKIKGKPITEAVDSEQKTDFASMTATLRLAKGVMTTDNLHVQSPLLRIKGEGRANYIQETVDFLLSSSIVGSLEGQGGKDIDDLKDVTIPVRVSGSWAKPAYNIEFDKLWKQLEAEKKKELEKQAKKELNKLLGSKNGEGDALADQLLKGLFN